MKPNDLTGAVIDRFAYDTPNQAQVDFYTLCDSDKPLVMVFLPNFGHPISRVFLTRYVDTLSSLVSGRLACVVRSEPGNIASKLESEYPFPLICDASGVLYEYFGVQTTTSRMNWSFAALRIFREAKKQGYEMDKNTEQLLPLTLVVGREGKILFSHYGTSLTDLPEDCNAMEHVCKKILENKAKNAEDVDDVQLSEAAGEESAPQQDEPDMDTFTHQVLFPGREVPQAEEPEMSTQEIEADASQQTQPIDLDGWFQQDNGEESVEESDEDSTEDGPSWNKLVGLFADRDKQ